MTSVAYRLVGETNLREGRDDEIESVDVVVVHPDGNIIPTVALLVLLMWMLMLMALWVATSAMRPA